MLISSAIGLKPPLGIALHCSLSIRCSAQVAAAYVIAFSRFFELDNYAVGSTLNLSTNGLDGEISSTTVRFFANTGLLAASLFSREILW